MYAPFLQLLNSIINNVEIREIDKTFPKCLSPFWSAWLQFTRTCGTGQFKAIHADPGSIAESNIHDFQRLQVSLPSSVHICFSDGFIFNSYLIQQLLRAALKHAQRPGFSFLSLRFGLHSFLLLNISEKNLSTSKRERSAQCLPGIPMDFVQCWVVTSFWGRGGETDPKASNSASAVLQMVLDGMAGRGSDHSEQRNLHFLKVLPRPCLETIHWHWHPF